MHRNAAAAGIGTAVINPILKGSVVSRRRGNVRNLHCGTEFRTQCVTVIDPDRPDAIIIPIGHGVTVDAAHLLGKGTAVRVKTEGDNRPVIRGAVLTVLTGILAVNLVVTVIAVRLDGRSRRQKEKGR